MFSHEHVHACCFQWHILACLLCSNTLQHLVMVEEYVDTLENIVN